MMTFGIYPNIPSISNGAQSPIVRHNSQQNNVICEGRTQYRLQQITNKNELPIITVTTPAKRGRLVVLVNTPY